jgi:hypothetical protein
VRCHTPSTSRYWEIGNELGAWESGTPRPDGKTMDVKGEHLKATKALFKIVSVVNGGGSVSGALYLDNLAFTVKVQKSWGAVSWSNNR